MKTLFQNKDNKKVKIKKRTKLIALMILKVLGKRYS